ncbi:Copper transport protein ATOX1 [Holothuria leucospilota]|uniref:Copper transport protein ATOX1 n=1 Tax=Holothuria leucospilota TaxID=206669 RepID=A0A9Q1BKB5_HOLLE|nr:Copper transport protein ATOX1 [Holothuria leucospilota]
MASKTYEYNVEMTCEGCSGAVDRILKRASDKVSDFEIDLPGKKVFVTTTVSSDEVLEMLKKSGKATKFVGEKSS